MLYQIIIRFCKKKSFDIRILVPNIWNCIIRLHQCINNTRSRYVRTPIVDLLEYVFTYSYIEYVFKPYDDDRFVCIGKQRESLVVHAARTITWNQIPTPKIATTYKRVVDHHHRLRRLQGDDDCTVF